MKKKLAEKEVTTEAQEQRAPVAEVQVAPEPVALQGEATHALTGAHLDAPSANAHPGAGHQSVVRSEVKS